MDARPHRLRRRLGARPAGPADVPPSRSWTSGPWSLLPGFVDCHVHLPQVPAAGMGAGMDLLAWLQRHVFPLERDFDAATAERLVPQVFRAMAAAGTTTIAAYGAIWQDSLDASFRAVEAHGMRAILGKVMMDRLTYDEALPRDAILEASLRESADLCERWHGRMGPTALRLHPAVRRELQRRHAARGRRPSPDTTARCGRRTSPRTPASSRRSRQLPRGPGLPGRLRPGRRRRTERAAGPRHPPLRPGAGTPRRVRARRWPTAP